jgi:ribosome-associated protein
LKDIRKLQRTVVKALEDIKARDIEIFDVTHLTTLFDRVIIASADSARQTKALAGNVCQKAKEAGAGVFGTEGEDTGEWVLVDLGDILVHVMQPAARAHYNLEELWNQPRPKAPRKAPAKRPAKRASATARR